MAPGPPERDRRPGHRRRRPDPSRDRLRDPNGDGTWEIRLRLRKGEELRYQFLIDGERWIADPQASLQVDDSFGGTSSVLQI